MRTPRVVISTFAVYTLLTGAVCAQDNAADTKTLIDVLQLQPGSVVAEIGAGSGELTIALARHVGPDGRIYSSELGPTRVQRLRAAVAKGAVPNVEVVEGHESRANLPDACCDAVFMRNVYHHFGDPAAMHASFLSALKPGGRIAVIDFSPPSATAPAGKRGEDGSHGVSDHTVASELEAAGFEVISSDERGNRWFIVVAAKPR
ncbi:MAG: class I SAM-dependent methyltransferase [Vicinamibacterales bacterium]